MYARLTGEDIASRAEGPLLFLHRTVDVGLNEAVEVEGADGQVRLGRIATLMRKASPSRCSTIRRGSV
jgi:V/A-type H+-transporting ATPase subunit B